MRIRLAKLEDAEAAAAVLRRSITQLCELDHRNDEAFLARWTGNKTKENLAAWIRASHVLVAEDARGIVGVAAVTAAGEVTLNYVVPEARFEGISKALLMALEERARLSGCVICTLESTKTALRFYAAAGYRQQDAAPERHLIKDLRPTTN